MTGGAAVITQESSQGNSSPLPPVPGMTVVQKSDGTYAYQSIQGSHGTNGESQAGPANPNGGGIQTGSGQGKNSGQIYRDTQQEAAAIASEQERTKAIAGIQQEYGNNPTFAGSESNVRNPNIPIITPGNSSTIEGQNYQGSTGQGNPLENLNAYRSFYGESQQQAQSISKVSDQSPSFAELQAERVAAVNAFNSENNNSPSFAELQAERVAAVNAFNAKNESSDLSPLIGAVGINAGNISSLFSESVNQKETTPNLNAVDTNQSLVMYNGEIMPTRTALALAQDWMIQHSDTGQAVPLFYFPFSASGKKDMFGTNQPVKSGTSLIQPVSLAVPLSLLPLGGGAAGAVETIGSKIGQVVRGPAATNGIEDIIKGVQAQESKILVSSTEKLSKNLIDYSQGTAGTSGKVTNEIPDFINQYGKLSEKPPLIDAIGATANEGSANIATTIISKGENTGVAYIPGEIKTVVPHEILLKDNYGNVANILELKPKAGAPGYYSGPVTSKNIEAVSIAEQSGLISREYNAFRFSLENVKKNPDFYPVMSTHPELLEGSKILPSLERPSILTLYRVESQGFELAKEIPGGIKSVKQNPLALMRGEKEIGIEEIGSKGFDRYISQFKDTKLTAKDPFTGKTIKLRGFTEETTTGGRLNKGFTNSLGPKTSKSVSDRYPLMRTNKEPIGSNQTELKTLTEKAQTELKNMIKGSTAKVSESKTMSYSGFAAPLTARQRKQLAEQQDHEIFLSYPTGTEEKLKGKSTTHGLSMSQNVLQSIKGKQEESNKQTTLFRYNEITSEKLKDVSTFTGLTTGKTITEQKQEPFAIFTQNQKPLQSQIYVPSYELFSETIQTTPGQSKTNPPPGEPGKGPPILPPLGSGSGSGLGWSDEKHRKKRFYLGNAPENQIVGLYKGFDVKYGYKVPKLSKSTKQLTSKRENRDLIKEKPNLLGNTKQSKSLTHSKKSHAQRIIKQKQGALTGNHEQFFKPSKQKKIRF